MSEQTTDGGKPDLTLEGKAADQPPPRKINESDDFGEAFEETPEQQTGGDGGTAKRKAHDVKSDVAMPVKAGGRNAIVVCFAAVALIAAIMLLSMCVNTLRVTVPAPAPEASAPAPRATFNVDNSGDKDTRPGSSDGGAPGASGTRQTSP